MTNAYDDLAHYYRTFRLSRWIVLGLVVLLFFLYASPKRHEDRSYHPNMYRYSIPYR